MSVVSYLGPSNFKGPGYTSRKRDNNKDVGLSIFTSLCAYALKGRITNQDHFMQQEWYVPPLLYTSVMQDMYGASLSLRL